MVLFLKKIKKKLSNINLFSIFRESVNIREKNTAKISLEKENGSNLAKIKKLKNATEHSFPIRDA